MEVTQLNIKRTIISQIPELELSDEKIIHNKVHYKMYDFFRVIPKGSKGFLVFKKDRTRSFCYFIELSSQRNIQKKNELFLNYKNYKKRLAVNRVFKMNCSFDEMLTCGVGTIFYGTMCWNENINIQTNLKYFITENIHYYKGEKIQFNGWLNLFQSIDRCIKNHIYSKGYNNNSVIVCMPIINKLPININSIIDDLCYDVYCIQYFNKNNDYYSYKIVNKKRREYMYVRANFQSDIYDLYDKNDTYIGICNIPDYKKSVEMNNIFRNIKENYNLDYLEESDDEEEFENTELDKYVYLEKKEVFECIYNKKLNMWFPQRHIDTYEMIEKSYNIYKIKY